VAGLPVEAEFEYASDQLRLGTSKSGPSPPHQFYGEKVPPGGPPDVALCPDVAPITDNRVDCCNLL
jgi:hypothetical protein